MNAGRTRYRWLLDRVAALAEPFVQLKAGRGLAIASITAFAVYGAGTGVSFLAQVIAARLLGADNFGEYAIVVAWIMLLASLCTLGFHVSLIRLIPAYLRYEKWSEANGAVRFALGIAALVSVVVAALGSAIVTIFISKARPELVRAFQIGLVALPFLTLHLVTASIVRAFGGVVLALAPDRILRDGMILIGLIAAASVGTTMNAATAATAMLVSSVAILLVVSYGVNHLRPITLTRHASSYSVREWSGLALPLVCLTLADNLLARSGVMVLGLSGRTRDAGVFAVAFSVAQLSTLPRMAVATIFAPAVSHLHAGEDRAALQTLSVRATWLTFSGTACVAIPIALFAPMLLRWFGPGFVDGASSVSVLAAGHLVCAAFGPQQHLITMTGHERVAATLLSICSVTTFALCLIMSGTFGILNMALAIVASLVIWNIAMAQFIHARLNLLPGLVVPFMTRTTAALKRSGA